MRIRRNLFAHVPLGCLLAACGMSDQPTDELPGVTSPGIASGDITSTTAVLWTRADGPGMLAVQVATDPELRAIHIERTAEARAEDDFTAEVTVESLMPATTYHYRWLDGERISETGTFRTAPRPDTRAPLRFGFSGDADGFTIDGVPFYNHFEVLDALRRDAPDFFVYLGDTIYSDSGARRRHTGQPPAQTLDEYRALYRENRRFAALHALMAATSTYAIWDDHEVKNNYGGQTIDPARYAAGREAFLEHMPVDEQILLEDPSCAGAPLFRVFHWGQLADIIILDERSCRSPDAADICQDDPVPTLPALLRPIIGLSPTPPAGCLEALAAPGRTLLGPVQKQAFKDALTRSRAKLKFVINQVPIQNLYAMPYDRWEGYAAEREEILELIRSQRIDNVVFLATDFHANFINDVFIDRFDDPEPLAKELVAGPIATRTFQQATLDNVGPGGLAVAHALLSLVGVDCRHLDAYAYGFVEVDADRGTAHIALKDDTGAVLRDQRLGLQACELTLGD